uniref:Uncharacterized protein n=1 Tax=Anopheles epiroticus TaxID=199890 RepID=A0A182PDK5_9DIPT
MVRRWSVIIRFICANVFVDSRDGVTQALALTRTKSPKKESSRPVSPTHTAERDAEMSSPKGTGANASSSSSSSSSNSNSSSAEPPTANERTQQPADVNGGSNHHHLPHHLPTASNGGSSSTTTPSTAGHLPARPELGSGLHPAISVSQTLLAAAATVNRSLTPRISVSSSLTAAGSESGTAGGPNAGSTGRDSGSAANGPHIDRTILQSPVAAVAAAAAAMQDRKQEFDFSKVNGR